MLTGGTREVVGQASAREAVKKNRRSFLTRHDGTGHGTDGDVALVSSLRAIDGDGGGEQL